jgi:hypothetical protein
MLLAPSRLLGVSLVLAVVGLLAFLSGSLPAAPFRRVLLLSCFAGFFVVTGVVFLFDAPPLRRAYVVGVLVVLFGLNVAGLSVAPLVDIQPYGPAAPAEYDVLELRVVDAAGVELRLDTRAIPPYTGSRLGWVAHRMSAETDDRRAIGRFVVSRANDHRQRVLHESPLDAARFPSHVADYRWTSERLEATGPFVGVRVYHLEVAVSDDGRRVVDRSETLVLEEWYDLPAVDDRSSHHTAGEHRTATPDRISLLGGVR